LKPVSSLAVGLGVEPASFLRTVDGVTCGILVALPISSAHLGTERG
jgi:hypothetical protein